MSHSLEEAISAHGTLGNPGLCVSRRSFVGTLLEEEDQKKPWSLDNSSEFSIEGMP